MVTLDHVSLDSVEDVEPHGGTKKLGTPLHLGVYMRLAHRSMADVLCNVVGSHFDQRCTKKKELLSGWSQLCRSMLVILEGE